MNRNHVIVPALAAILAFSLPAGVGIAQTTSSPVKPTLAAAHAKSDAATQEMMKYSENGHAALADIAAARVAIFNGDPKRASDLIAKAKDSVAKAETEEPSLPTKVAATVAGKIGSTETGAAKTVGTAPEANKTVMMVPVDGQIALADDFVPSPEKMTHVAKANEHFKNGKSKEGLEELRLGEIEVNYTRLLMPIDFALQHIDQAASLMKEQKYYEANLALKAVDDSLVADSVTLIDTPKKKS